MARFSKPAVASSGTLWTGKLPYTCYELGHTWTPSCTRAVLGIAGSAAVMSSKMYGMLYLIMAIARRKKRSYFLKRFWVDTLRSTAFLSINAGVFIAAFCLWRHSLSHISITGVYAAAFTASLASIFIERTPRHSLLALYVTNVALETAFRMLNARGVVRPIKYGEVGLFSLAMAGYLCLFRKAGGLDGSSVTAIRMIFGSSEGDRFGHQASDGAGTVAPGRSTASGVVLGTWHRVLTQAGCWLNQTLTALHINGKHQLCPHSHGCVYASVLAAARGGSTGFIIQAARRLPSVLRYFKNPRMLFKAWLLQKANFQCGAFVASMCLIYQAVCCVLRHLRNQDSEIHGLIAGLLSGLGMMFYRSSTLALYMLLRLVMVLFNKSVEKGLIPEVPHGPVVVYAISTAVLIHAAVWEPHNMRPGYWKFVLQLTGGKFAEMNRQLMEPLGCDSSKLFRDWWPQYDPRYTTLMKPS